MLYGYAFVAVIILGMTRAVYFLSIFLKVIYTVNCSSACKESLGLDGCSLLPPDGQCGKLHPVPRVVGGRDAALGQFPWTTLLYASPSRILRAVPELLVPGGFHKRTNSLLRRLLERLQKFIVCGATIVSDRFLVTAAHCCNPPPGLSIVSVRVGEHDLEQSQDCEAGRCAPPPQDINVDKVVIHEKHDPISLEHDICLLRLGSKIEFNDFVSPICLPTSKYIQNKNFVGTNLEVAGFGITSFAGGRGVFSKVMQTATLQVRPPNECVKVLGRHAMKSPQLCVGGGGDKDTCTGDSGGPLMANLADNEANSSLNAYYLVGVVSYGDTHCRGVKPGAYVDLTKYLEWILHNMELMEGS